MGTGTGRVLNIVNVFEGLAGASPHFFWYGNREVDLFGMESEPTGAALCSLSIVFAREMLALPARSSRQLVVNRSQ